MQFDFSATFDPEIERTFHRRNKRKCLNKDRGAASSSRTMEERPGVRLRDQLKSKRRTPSRNSSKAKQPFNTRSMDDLLSFLDQSQVEENDCVVCAVIHNIDGPGLRDAETQQYLAQMASCSRIRVVASIDHVNAPLLWDKKMVHTQFNWCWYHVPTYAPYKVEGTFFPLILAHGGSAQSAKTAAIVLQSLTPNARSVFKVLAEYQLSHPDEEGTNPFITRVLSINICIQSLESASWSAARLLLIPI